MANFLAALRVRLVETPALAGLQGVHLDVLPPRPIYPCLVLNEITRPVSGLTGDYYETLKLQVTVLSRDDEEAWRLGEAAWSALAPGSGDTPLTFDEGVEIRQRVPGDKRGPRQPKRDKDADAEPVWAFHFYCRFFLGRAYREVSP